MLFVETMSKAYSNIVVYTSSSDDYAEYIYSQLNAEYFQAHGKNAFNGLYSRKDCPLLKGSLTTKDLTKVNHFKFSRITFFSQIRGFLSLDEIVLVDDDPTYTDLDQVHNLVHAQKWKDEQRLYQKETHFELMARLLIYLSQEESIPTTMKKLKQEWIEAGFMKKAEIPSPPMTFFW